ncbi:MAG: YciI family protein, partial [Pseudomonadota bacterium]
IQTHSRWELPLKFIVLFEDNPQASPDTRATHMPDHLRFLQANADKVQAAGPLSSVDAAAAGGAWLVEADNEAEVDSLITEDPLWSTGLRAGVRILVWNQVFANGQTLID